MNRNFFLFFSISFFIHIFLMGAFLFLPLKILPFENTVSVQFEEQSFTKEAKQIIEQPFFNNKDPLNTRYLSQYNNTTREEQKGKLGRGRNSLSQNQLLQEESLSWDVEQLNSPFMGRIDFLEVQKEEEITLLNTQEIWFFGFYSRVKNQIYWHWIRTLKQQLQDVNSVDLFNSSRLFITRIEALLDTQGNLSSIIIREKSGLEELDTASVLAFQKAHPFPNPPSPMVENGQVRLEYAFVLSQNKNFKASSF